MIVYVQDVLKANKEKTSLGFHQISYICSRKRDKWLCFNTLLSYCCYIGLTKIFVFSIIDFVSNFFCKFSLATFKSIFCNRHISTSFMWNSIQLYSISTEERISYNMTENIFCVHNKVMLLVFSLLLIIHNYHLCMNILNIFY